MPAGPSVSDLGNENYEVRTIVYMSQGNALIYYYDDTDWFTAARTRDG